MFLDWNQFIMRMNWWYLTKVCISIDTSKVWVGIVTCRFLQIYNGPWFLSEFTISWERIDGFQPNFAYILVLTRSRLVLLHVNFCKFIKELRPLIDVRTSLSLNILNTNWWISTKFCICIDNDKILVGIVTCQLPQLYKRVMALDWCQNFVSAQYLEYKWLDFDQILHMHWYWQNLGKECYTSFSTTLLQNYGPFWHQNFGSAQYYFFLMQEQSYHCFDCCQSFVYI